MELPSAQALSYVWFGSVVYSYETPRHCTLPDRDICLPPSHRSQEGNDTLTPSGSRLSIPTGAIADEKSRKCKFASLCIIDGFDISLSGSIVKAPQAPPLQV